MTASVIMNEIIEKYRGLLDVLAVDERAPRFSRTRVALINSYEQNNATPDISIPYPESDI